MDGIGGVAAEDGTVHLGVAGLVERRGVGGTGRRRDGRRYDFNRWRGEKGRRGGQERGKDVVAIVNSGGERGVLDFGGKERGRSRWLGWKKTDKLKCFGMRACTCNTVILGNGLIDGGRHVKKPVVAKL